MPVIKSISDLRSKANQIADLAETMDEPIFITRNGEGDLVVMSMDLRKKIREAAAEIV